MSEERNGSEVEVFQTNRFERQMNKLSQKQCELVEDEIDKIIDNPEIGTRKKGGFIPLVGT